MGPTIDRRLQQQNEQSSWRDCNDAGLPHRWVPEQVPNWWRCVRCPVTTRWTGHGYANRVPPLRLL